VDQSPDGSPCDPLALPSTNAARAVGLCARLRTARADAGDDAVADVAPETCPVESMMHPPLRENACNAEQLAQLAACGAWPCPSFDYVDAGADCLKCMEGSENSATWSPVLAVTFGGEDVSNTANTFGCVDLLSSMVGDEPGSCGDALWQRFACVGVVCDVYPTLTMPPCTVSFDGGTCEQAALLTTCKAYDDAIVDRCSGLVGPHDTPAPIVAPCFPDPTITDPNAQRIALWNTLAKIFCGP
jgi:hypothetical protein